MAFSVISTTATGSTNTFPINFTLGFNNRNEVTCQVNNEVDGSNNPIYRVLTWINDGMVTIPGALLASGTPVVFKRTVTKTALIHDYSNGEAIEEDNLDESNKQNMMGIHELLDGRFTSPFQQDLDMGTHKIINVIPGTADTDAATYGQLNSVSGGASNGAFLDVSGTQTLDDSLLWNPTTLKFVRRSIAYLATKLGVNAITAFGTSIVQAANAAAGRAVLGLGSIATQAFNAVGLTGGTIDNIVIGGTTPVNGTFNLLSSTSLVTGSINGGQLAGFKNGLYNGNGAVGQRSLNWQNVINVYTLDRWYVFGGPANLFLAQLLQPTLFPRGGTNIRFGRIAGSTQVFNIGFGQALESRDSYRFAGKQVTLSFRASVGGNFSAASNNIIAAILGGTGTDQSINTMLGSVLTSPSISIGAGAPAPRYSVTITIPSNITQVGVYFSYQPVGTAGTNDFIDISEIQLEEGNIATPYESRPYALELWLCQRYYETTFPTGTTVGNASGNQGGCIVTGVASSANWFGNAMWRYKNTKRTVTPAIVAYNPFAGNSNWRNSANTADYGGVALSQSGDSGCVLSCSNVIASGLYAMVHLSSDAEL